MEPIGEVIASSTRAFTAEVLREAEVPAFGAWVRSSAGSHRVYGVVSYIASESIEPGRLPVALGMEPEVIRREMPHVLELIRTTFQVQILAYQDARGRLWQKLPPHPPLLHERVYRASDEEVRQLGEPFDYLRMLVQQGDAAVPVDELLVALLQQSVQAQTGPSDIQALLLGAGRVLARLFRDDHDRLQAIFRRIAIPGA